MRFLCLGAVLWGGALLAAPQETDLNVNSRYTVESVEIRGEKESKISRGLLEDIHKLVGEHFDQSRLDHLAKRIRDELRVKAVSPKLKRGSTPDHVQVVFEVTRHQVDFDLDVAKFLYSTKQGWSAVLDASTKVSTNTFRFGILSDGDEMAERYAGIYAGYENRKMGSEHVRLGFQFESYHQQWNRSTLSALEAAQEAPGIYRTRQNFQPALTFVLAKPLALSVGASFERFQSQFPAARTQAANAVVTTLRYHRLLEGSEAKQELAAGYSLRAATRIFSSDFVYARHRWELRYQLSRGHHVVADYFTAGLITGRAPLFERYALGNSSTLRGWNKYEIDPLGGGRLAHNSLEYRYYFFDIFYDAGSVWDAGAEPVARHSLGVGLRQDNLFLAVAFPIKNGRAEPIFMLGMNH